MIAVLFRMQHLTNSMLFRPLSINSV
jgi:hypothetical protein